MKARESSISRETARRIVRECCEPYSYDPMGDYYVVTTEEGVEELWRGGDDAPTATNRTTTSWLGSR